MKLPRRLGPQHLLAVAAAFGLLVPAGSGPAAAAENAPPSWGSPTLEDLTRVETYVVPEVDPVSLVAEDESRSTFDKTLRVGLPLKTDVDPVRNGTWDDLDQGGRAWRLSVVAPGAKWIVLGFGTFRLPVGASLWAYAPDRSVLLGPYGADDVRDHGQLWLPPLAGSVAVIEIEWPDASSGSPNVHLGTVSSGYRDLPGFLGDDGTDAFGDSGSCNNDVNCPEWTDWQDEKRGVVNLLSGGSAYCSGSMVVTTRQDCLEPYVLTAAHCLNTQSEAASTVFLFNYERSGCNSGSAPTSDTVSGSSLIATYSPSDATLLQMSSDPPVAFDTYYNGWSRDTAAATTSIGIHHPQGDAKKISQNDDTLIDGLNYGSDHWRVTEWEDGTTEPISSGSPIFDQNSRIVGQLHGGTASCSSITWDEYGKVDVSWNGGGTPASSLAPWLDPDGTGALFQDGVDAATCGTPQPRLRYLASTVDDAAWNGNGVAEPGESILLPIDVENFGTLTATAVAGTLSTTTPSVTIVDASASWPDIPQQDARTSNAPHFEIGLDPGLACGTLVDLTLVSTALEGSGSWASDFELRVGSPQIAQLFFDDMESGVGSFTTASLEGTNGWSQTQGDAFSPATSWFVQDISSRSDSVLVMPTLTAVQDGAVLSFRHRYNTENSWDGGVLEYDAGSGWTDAGSLITAGGYSSSINSSASSNLAGRSAWAGDSGGFVLTEVDLSSLAGQDVQIRWRLATDTSVSDEGWYVDDVKVERTSYDCAPAGLARPGEASPPGGPGAPLTITKTQSGYSLGWSTPTDGGAADDFQLYRTAVGPAVTALDPLCEADLGAGESVVLGSLTSDHGFIVVARNAGGEGSLGQSSSGEERPSAADPCP